MSEDVTIPQSRTEQRQAQQMSLQGARPPVEVPGYEAERLLGVGAYGEVWVAVERNTGRRVAIKFYAHRGGLDWALLSREVEKLAFLFADRYVVQLIGVGWDASPPYYIMEYLERGSLADRLEQGPLPVEEAVALFHDVAVGLLHAHGKGVLHCDLKPANILLDQDGRPRLADFGQSRLSHEQAPALGTLFYMAPEQADLQAAPDARWDVYALGALLYCMLTGSPPYRTPEILRQLEQAPNLVERLAVYRRWIRHSPRPTAHRQLPGVDRDLADIIDRCLAVDPEKRFPNVQAVLDALYARQLRRQRRPMLLVGAVGPVLLLLVVGFFAWQGATAALQRSEEALIQRALESNKFAAQYAARTTAAEVARRYRAVEKLLQSDEFLNLLQQTIQHPELQPILRRLADPQLSEAELRQLAHQLRGHPQRRKLQEAFQQAIPPEMHIGKEVNSWFLNDPLGNQIARVPEEADVVTIGRNYAWRSYFHGGPMDMPDRRWRPQPGQHLQKTQMSAAYQSEATGRWNVAVSTPVRQQPGGQFLGVVGLTVGIGTLVELPPKPDQFAVLVEEPTAQHPGRILEHPLFQSRDPAQPKIPKEFSHILIKPDDLPATWQRRCWYEDPVGNLPGGEYYQRRWLAEMESVQLAGQPTGWLIIVQQSYETAIGQALRELRQQLVGYALAAAAGVILVVVSLWTFALRMFRESAPAAWLGGKTGSGSEKLGSTPTPSAPQTHRISPWEQGISEAPTEPSPTEPHLPSSLPPSG
ncbi:MAG: serine/threonine protein kinase [Thermoguttaceae bacterium]|nr:serine/threonine protein kinase [Thermoguttaceae bacterium]